MSEIERLKQQRDCLLAACREAVEFLEQPTAMERTVALRLAGIGGLYLLHQLKEAILKASDHDDSPKASVGQNALP